MPNKRKLIDLVEIGSKGGRARAKSLSTLDLQESGQSEAKARWDAYYRLHPEKLQAKKEREEISVSLFGHLENSERFRPVRTTGLFQIGRAAL